MILCVSLSPAWDVTYGLDRLTPGQTHRVTDHRRRAGGKGANVARVLVQLGDQPHLLAPLGGPSGDGFVGELVEAGIAVTRAPCRQPIRTSVVIQDPRTTTVVNEPGAFLATEDWENLVARACGLLPGAEVLVLTGSLPPGAPDDAYAVLTNHGRRAGTPVLLDAGGMALGAALAAGPDLVKPNVHELAEHTGSPIGTVDELLSAAGRLLDQGARSALVSRGEAGLVAVDRTTAVSVRLASTLQGNPTGAGDALTAAVAQGLASRRPLREVVERAVAVAAASVTRPQAGETDLALASRLRPEVRVEELTWAW